MIFLVFLSFISYIAPNLSDHKVEGKQVFFQVMEKNISTHTIFTGTTLEMGFNVVNDLNYDIGQIVLDVELLDDNIPVKEISIIIDIEVKHHEQLLGTIEKRYDYLFFDDINILSVHTVEESFFESYNVAINLGVFYIVIVFLMWLVNDIGNGYILSEVHQTFKNYWWAMLVLLVFVPIFLCVFSYLGRYEVLTTIYGWVLLIASLVTIPVMYLLLIIYHLIKEKHRI